MELEKFLEKFWQLVIDYTPKVIMAVITLIIGLWIIARISAWLTKAIEKSGADLSLAKFISSLINIGLKIMILLSVASIFGVDTTSFIAIFSALMVGIGMALNGMLGHAASGVLLLIFEPFKVGDLVKIGSNQTQGTVDAVNAFNTTLKTLDNKRIIIGNSNVMGNDITNISGQGEIGVELVYGIAYGGSIDKAREVILEVGRSCPYILDEPKHEVFVTELADSSVNLITRPFCKSEHYWETFYYMQENVKKAFDKNDVDIPYPTMDINLNK